MELVHDYNQVRELTVEIKSYKEGFMTNFFMNEPRCNLLINNELIYRTVFGKCAFILHKDHDFYHVYYQTTSESDLSEGLQQLGKQYRDMIFVADIIGVNAIVRQVAELFTQAGFNAYSELLRMSRTKGLDSPQVLNPDIEFASPAQVGNIRDILDTYFDKFSEQIPLSEEINQWIEDKKVLVLRENELIIGLVVFEITGLTSYLRYWFTHPAYRNRKIGSAMLRRFFYECRYTKRQQFWVIASNKNAIKRYRHYGFEQEQLVDMIMKK
jgi:ribosomal protein S18 acetylase RimI-like enzyme